MSKVYFSSKQAFFRAPKYSKENAKYQRLILIEPLGQENLKASEKMGGAGFKEVLHTTIDDYRRKKLLQEEQI